MFGIIIAGLLVMTASLAGILFVSSYAEKFLHNKIDLLISFSAGVFIVTSASLILEVFHITESILQTVVLVTIGYLAAALLHKMLPETHHHHDDTCADTRGAKKIIIGDAIHNIADGIILVPAFLISSGLGAVVAASIFIHELLQEISEFFILKRAGYSNRKALGINFLVSSTIFIGIAIGFLVSESTLLESILLSVSGGFFLHIVIHDLLPRKHGDHSHRANILLVLLGVLLMLGVTLSLQESHDHEGDDHDAEQQSATESH